MFIKRFLFWLFGIVRAASGKPEKTDGQKTEAALGRDLIS